MERIINTQMLLNPFNWIIIYLVVAFIGMAIRTVSKSAPVTNAA